MLLSSKRLPSSVNTGIIKVVNIIVFHTPSMSEYQYYYFESIDKPLTAQQQDELRAISTRAKINSRRFENEYNYGDLKADPDKLLKKYFDVHLYYANWGTRK